MKLKLSALKNELNAALHFIKFVKRSRNLEVTDPTFNATLENTNDIISTFQVIGRCSSERSPTQLTSRLHGLSVSVALSVCHNVLYPLLLDAAPPPPLVIAQHLSLLRPATQAEYCDERVCLSATLSSEVHVRSSPNFLSLLLMAMARLPSGGVVIGYSLPVYIWS